MDAARYSTLHDELCVRLHNSIADGTLTPGNKIPERELCERYGVSRTPLREAIKVLASEGLVRLEPNRGAIVTEFTVEELLQALPIAEAVAMLIGELACRCITEEDVAVARDLYSHMISAHEVNDHKTCMGCSRKIQDLILNAAANPLLTSIHKMTFLRFGQIRLRLHFTPWLLAQVRADHEAIMAALEARQGTNLGLALKRHVAVLFNAYREAVSANGSDREKGSGAYSRRGKRISSFN